MWIKQTRSPLRSQNNAGCPSTPLEVHSLIAVIQGGLSRSTLKHLTRLGPKNKLNCSYSRRTKQTYFVAHHTLRAKTKLNCGYPRRTKQIYFVAYHALRAPKNRVAVIETKTLVSSCPIFPALRSWPLLNLSSTTTFCLHPPIT